MFCLKCGESISDRNEICPICGINLKLENDEQAVICASKKETSEFFATKALENDLKKPFIVAIIAVVW